MNQKELCQMLSEVGFIASRYMMFEEAARLHASIETAFPNTEAPVIGEAYNLICRQSTNEAVTLLSKFIDKKKNEVSDLMKGFMGLALYENGNMGQASDVLKTIEDGDDEVAKSMAADIMKMINNQ